MKNFKKVLALVLAVVMLLSFATVASAADSSSYSDADKIDYTEAVDVLSAIGILDGFPDKTFRPEANITRAQAAKIIAMFDNNSVDISDIYTSANPFTDCVGNWAESYIAYGAKTGILAGVGGTKFAPNNNVTGTQFLKMALVVLGYDAKAEELEGKNWDVNTLALAKRVGLTTGFAKTHNFKNALTRQEAAQIMLNALRAGTVEYGSRFVLGTLKFDKETGYYYNGVVGSQPYMTIAGACLTGDKLGAEWKLSEGYATDAFMRPLRTWKLGTKTIGTYMFPVATSYTTKFDMCTALVGLGIAKNDGTAITVSGHYVNGAKAVESISLAVEKYSHDVVSYHDDCGMKDHRGGAQGTLSQFFYIDSDDLAEELYGDGAKAGYYVTEIDTFLANVESVIKTNTNKEGHLISVQNATLDLANTLGGEHYNRNINENAAYAAATGVTGLSKGDYVLVTLSAKTDGNNMLYYKVSNGVGVYTAITCEAAKSEAATYTGFRTYSDETQLNHSADWTPNALHFHLNKDWLVTADGINKANLGSTFVFIYDAYGNIIGVTTPAAAATQYLTINGLWLEYVHGTGVAEWHADVVTMDGEMHKNVTVAKLNGDSGDKWVETLHVGWSAWEARIVMSNWYHDLYTFSVNKDGEYSINSFTENKADVTGATFKQNKPAVAVDGETKFRVDKDTQFLLHKENGTYEAVTGYDKLASMYVKKAVWVDNDDDGYAEIVYFCKPIYTNDSFVGIFKGFSNGTIISENGVAYREIFVYVNGELKTVYVPEDQAATLGYNVRWIKMTYRNAGDIDYVDIDTVTYVTDAHVEKIGNGTIALKLADNTEVDLTLAEGMVIYVWNTEKQIVEKAELAELEKLVAGDSYVSYHLNGAGDIDELYIWEGYNDLTFYY